MQYATVTDAGVLTGFYDDALNKTIPAEAQPLTPGQYAQWLAEQGSLIWRDGDLVAAPPPPAPPAPPAPTAADLMAQIQALMARVQAMTPAGATGGSAPAQT